MLESVETSRLLKFGHVKSSFGKFLAPWMVGGYDKIQCGADKPMVCPSFCSPHSSGDEDITNVAPADNDIIYQVPLFRSGVHPRILVLICHSEYRVCDDQVTLCALAQQQEAISIHFASAMFAKYSFPLIVITANSGVKIDKKY